MPEPTPEAWVQIRHDYEHTDRPLAHICTEHDISIPMMRYRMKLWEWRRRKPLIPREGPPPVPVMPQEMAAPTPYVTPVHPTPPAFANASAGDPPPPGEGEEKIVPRLQSAVARVLPAIEATIARLASSAHQPRDMEQSGRTLGALTRTLRELNTLLAQHNARLDAASPAVAAVPFDDMPEDIDTFRINLARRIEAFVASRTSEHGAQPGSWLPLQAQK